MPRFAVGTDDDLGLKIGTQFSTPNLKRACRAKLVIVEVRVNEKNLHE
jgi:hypothetical protein